MLLSIFFWFNCVFGGLPFTIKLKDGVYKIEMFPPGLLFILLMLCCFYRALTSRNLCLGYGFRGGEPQFYNCLLAQISILLVFLRRLCLIRKLRTFLLKMLQDINISKDFLIQNTILIVFDFLMSASGACMLYLYFYWTMGLNVGNVSDVALGSFPGRFGFYCILMQATFICFNVKSALSRINSKLQEITLEEDKLNLYKRGQSKCFELFRTGIGLYSVDILLVMGVLGVESYIKCNDFVGLTIKTLMLKKTNLLGYSVSIAYYTSTIVFSFTHIYWFCSVSKDLNKETSQTKRILFKIDTNTLQESTREELLLFLEQLDHTKLEVNAFGFFNVGRRLLFKGICLVTTFIVLFIQLNQIQRIT